MVNNLPVIRKIQIQSLGGEDPLEEEMPTHQNSCLGNSMERGACLTIVHGVTNS